MASPGSFDLAQVDHLLATTRSIRWRLDLERPVAPELLVDCVRLATYAPNASNAQDWRWLLVSDPDKKAAIAEVYREGMLETMQRLLAERTRSGDSEGVRHSRSVIHLAQVLERVPVLVIPCVAGRQEDDLSLGGATRLWASIYPAVWSFQLALRSRGLGSTLTTSHLLGEARVAALLGIPDDHTQACLIPVAHIRGDDVAPPPRRPVADVIAWDDWTGKR